MEEANKAYELGELKADHLFLLVRVLSKAGLRDIADAIKATIDEAKAGGASSMDVEEIGFGVIVQIAAIVAERLPDCKDELYAFLAAVTDLEAQQVAELGVIDFTDLVTDVIGMDGFRDFFMRVAKLLGLESSIL